MSFQNYYTMPSGPYYYLVPNDKSPLTPGTVVELVDCIGLSAQLGARATVVDGKKQFPDRWTVFNGGDRFIWVVWDRQDNRRFGQCDGTYERCRFKEVIIKGLEPPNNDGRKECFWCGATTKSVPGITNMYDICTKCGR